MSYEVYITRADFWAENDGHEISAEEWLDLVKNDPELTLEPANGKYFTIWESADKGIENWFDWREGNIYLEHANKQTVRKMIQIAKKLNAQVQGSEGELYNEENMQDSLLEKLIVFLKQGRKK